MKASNASLSKSAYLLAHLARTFQTLFFVGKMQHSAYDYRYKTYRCLYCEAPIALTPESLALLIQDARDALPRGNGFFYLTPEQDATLCKEVEQRESGVCLSDKQCLHDRCLATLSKPENREQWEKIKAADRRLMTLPDAETHNIYDVYYNSGAQVSRHFCGFCHNTLTGSWPGFAYCKKSNITKDCAFLHYSCFRELYDARTARQEADARWRRVELNYLTSDLYFSPELAIKDIASRNDRWISLMRRYVLENDECYAFIEWYAFLLKQKSLWQEKQTHEWVARLKEEDLQSLRESISKMTKDERLALSARLTNYITPTLQQQCITPLSPRLCESAIDMEKREPLLYHNLLIILEKEERETI